MEILEWGNFVENGDYNLHSSFTKVINYQKNKELISLTTKDVGGGPNNIILSRLPIKSYKNIKIKDNAISILENNIVVKKSKYPLADVLIEDVFTLNEKLKKLINDYSDIIVPKSLFFLILPSFEVNFTSAFDRAFKDYILNSVNSAKNIFELSSLLKGVGNGLTPAGDDFNMGILYALNYLKKIGFTINENNKIQYYNDSLGQNLISNTFLKYAYLGELYEVFYRFLKSLKDEQFIYENFKKLLSKGHSSGSDMFAGFVYAVNEISKNKRIRSEI